MENFTTYYRVPREIFRINEDAKWFFMTLDGNGMEKAGLYNNDLLLFKETSNPAIGSIVVAEVKGKIMCRRYLRDGSKIILRREDGYSPDLSVKTCKFKGELVSLVRNFDNSQIKSSFL